MFQTLKYHGQYTIKKPKKEKKITMKEKPATGGNIIKKSKLVIHPVGKPLIIGMVEPNDEKTFEAEFDVPELPPSHKDTQAVEISYKFKLEVKSNRKEEAHSVTLNH